MNMFSLNMDSSSNGASSAIVRNGIRGQLGIFFYFIFCLVEHWPTPIQEPIWLGYPLNTEYWLQW